MLSREGIQQILARCTRLKLQKHKPLAEHIQLHAVINLKRELLGAYFRKLLSVQQRLICFQNLALRRYAELLVDQFFEILDGLVLLNLDLTLFTVKYKTWEGDVAV